VNVIDSNQFTQVDDLLRRQVQALEDLDILNIRVETTIREIAASKDSETPTGNVPVLSPAEA
jgi:hypothetical protein